MTSEVERKNHSKKKKKKPKKDKWGQPILCSNEEEQIGEVHVGEEQIGEEHVHDQEYGHGDIKYEANKIVISGMPYSTTRDEIHDLFKDVGTISDIQLSVFPDTGKFRGLAFVTFEALPDMMTEEEAKNSLQFDGTKMGNRFVKVECCRLDSSRKRKSEFLEEPKKVEGNLSAYIGNLPWDITEDDIRTFFETSKIMSMRLATDKITGRFRGFGHIDFEDDESLEEAIKKKSDISTRQASKSCLCCVQ